MTNQNTNLGIFLSLVEKRQKIQFVYQFENFLRYISHEVNDNASVEKALTYLGQCLSGKARDWFQTHVGPPRAADHGRSKAEYEQLLKDFKKCFHPMGKTTEQLT